MESTDLKDQHEHGHAERHPVGRPLDTSRDDALRDAALSLLAEIGYDHLTVDAIAARAGAGKATIYRRWSGKAELVLDALTCEKSATPIPDTGTLRGDLKEMTRRAIEAKARMDSQVMIGLVSVLPHDQELRDAFQERLVASHLSTLTLLFDRAVDRGEMSPIDDLETIAAIVPAMVLHRLLFLGREPDQQFFETVIDEIILPLVEFRSNASRSGGSATS